MLQWASLEQDEIDHTTQVCNFPSPLGKEQVDGYIGELYASNTVSWSTPF
jgi:hypothetical protein